MSILWSAVTRDGVVLAEAGDDSRAGEVLALAKKILAKKPTPGWEFEKLHALRAIKFHVHEGIGGGGAGGSGGKVVWAVCCVYDAKLEELQAKGFLEKLALMTEPPRSSALWRTGGALAAQESFAPTLLQRMEQVASLGRVAMVSRRADEVKQLMSDNIELLLDREVKLERLDEKASAMNKLSQTFRKRARDARRFQQWQNAKFGLAAGTAVTVGVVVVVAPLVALL